MVLGRCGRRVLCVLGGGGVLCVVCICRICKLQAVILHMVMLRVVGLLMLLVWALRPCCDVCCACVCVSSGCRLYVSNAIYFMAIYMNVDQSRMLMVLVLGGAYTSFSASFTMSTNI